MQHALAVAMPDCDDFEFEALAGTEAEPSDLRTIAQSLADPVTHLEVRIDLIQLRA